MLLELLRLNSLDANLKKMKPQIKKQNKKYHSVLIANMVMSCTTTIHAIDSQSET